MQITMYKRFVALTQKMDFLDSTTGHSGSSGQTGSGEGYGGSWGNGGSVGYSGDGGYHDGWEMITYTFLFFIQSRKEN